MLDDGDWLFFEVNTKEDIARMIKRWFALQNYHERKTIKNMKVKYHFCHKTFDYWGPFHIVWCSAKCFKTDKKKKKFFKV
jgi:hypothetical protein